MRNYLIALIACASAFGADLLDPKDIVAQQLTSGGFAPPEIQAAHGVQVSKDGVVYRVQQGKAQESMKLNEREFTFLKNNIAALSVSQLHPEGQGPLCMDA